MEKILATLFSIILLTIPLGYAAIIEPGDDGAQFATEVAHEKCSEPEVVAVYTCTGNVVKVTSLVNGSEVVFYKPNGRVIPCVGEPKDMGAECVQLLHPNSCKGESVCTPPPDLDEPIMPPNESDDSNNGFGVGIPDIEPNMSVPDRIEPPEEGGALSQEVFIFAIIIIGMIAVAIINYVYFKSKGT
jgi:hypothetical protein